MTYRDSRSNMTSFDISYRSRWFQNQPRLGGDVPAFTWPEWVSGKTTRCHV